MIRTIVTTTKGLHFSSSTWLGVFAIVVALAATATTAKAQQSSLNIDQTVDRIVAAENREIATIRRYSPIIETYIQDMRADNELGSVPVKDHYFLGLVDFKKGVVDHSLLAKQKGTSGPFAHFTQFFSTQYEPVGFLEMVFIDKRGIDRSHYHFDFVRREFLGEVRCLVFDVEPLPNTGKFRFKGRIWANENDFTIVRFNGIYTPVASLNGYNLHFDSWRTNMQPGLWLPTYIFSQESGLKAAMYGVVRFRSQTRLWGYDLQNPSRASEFSELQVEAPGAIQDAAPTQDPTPVEAEREWQARAADNVLERLQRAGLVAPAGPVDKVLATVVKNIEVTNNLDVQPEIRCRVMLSSTLESFSLGHTIVISRGLLDVLPDEASLATMLAQNMGEILVSKRTTDAWGFNDLTNVATTDVVSRFSFRAMPDEQKQANQKALDLLKNSPYKDKLKTAGLFLKQLDIEQKALPALISPSLGDRVFLGQEMIESAPQIQPANLDQISALPLGGRIKLDPWTDRVEMVKAQPVALISVREKMPFEVTPFEPFLTYYTTPNANSQSSDVTARTEASTARTDPARAPAPQR
jgi:hypothetical protein